MDPRRGYARGQTAASLIAGDADNGGGGIANGFTTPYQKMRAGLGLLTDAAGNKAVVISFSINGENPRGPGHGFVVAYDVRGLNRDAGFTPTPAIWNVTPGGGAGGIWMSGSGPAIDGARHLPRHRQRHGSRDDARQLRRVLRQASLHGRRRRRQQRQADARGRGLLGRIQRLRTCRRDQDLGAAGVVLIPETGNLIGGGKDGILYNLDKNNLGKDTWNPQFNLPFVATYLPNQPNGAAGLPTTTAANPNWPIVNRDRNLMTQTPTGKTHHIHGTPVYMERAKTGIIYLWGENERLKAYNFDFATKRITGFRGEGTQFASGNMPAPGGMPGGRLVVSSNGNTSARGHLGRVSDAGQRQLQRRSRRAGRLRRGGGEQRQDEAAVSQRREPRERPGELRQVRHAGRRERQGLRRDVQQQGRAVRALTMKKILAITAVALTSFQFAGHGQAPAAPPATVPAAQQPAAPAAEPPAAATT